MAFLVPAFWRLRFGRSTAGFAEAAMGAADITSGDEARVFSIYRETPAGRERRLLTHSMVASLALRVPASIQNNPPPGIAFTEDTKPTICTLALAMNILGMFFGQEWALRNFAVSPKRGRFLPLEFRDDVEVNNLISRTIQLAEMIFNFQRVAGVDDVLDQIRDGMIESGFAELEAGVALHRHGVAFRFVEAQGRRGKDYDIEYFHFNGRVCCADAKAKLEINEFSPKSIMSSLVAARKKNLPPDKPGTVIVKVPVKWLEAPDFFSDFNDTVLEFFRNTSRVVSVIGMTTPIAEYQGHAVSGHRIEEIVNPRHKFDRMLDWRLINRFPEPLPNHACWSSLYSLFGRLPPLPSDPALVLGSRAKSS